MATLKTATTAQLRQILELREQIETAQAKLDAILGGKAAPATKIKRKTGRTKGKRTMSPEGRAKIAAAQKARWAKLKG